MERDESLACMDVFNADAAKRGYLDFIATRPPARCPYDSKLFRSIAIRHFEASDLAAMTPQLLQSGSIDSRRRRSQQLTDRLSGGSVGDVSCSSSSYRRESSRSAMLVKRSLRDLQRQQSISQMPVQLLPASNSVSRRASSASSMGLPAAPRSPCFTSQDQLLDHLRRLLAGGGGSLGIRQEGEVLFVVGSSDTAPNRPGALSDSAQAIADCLLGLPPPQSEPPGDKQSSRLLAFLLSCLDQVRPEELGDDDKWTMSQLKVFGLFLALDQSGCSDELDSDDRDSLVKWSFNQLRSHLFFPDGRVSGFLSDRMASAFPCGAGLARLIRDIRLEMALPVSDAEDSDAEDYLAAGGSGDVADVGSTNPDASRDIGSYSGLLDATIEDANAEFPDLSTAPAIPAFYCGVEPPVLCDGGGRGVGVGRYDRLANRSSSSTLGRSGSSCVLRGMTNQRQLYVPASTVAATSVVGSGRLPSSASAASFMSTLRTPSPGSQQKQSQQRRRRSRIRVLETPTPKRSRLRLQRLASERTRHCPIVIGESPPASPTSPSPSTTGAHQAADFDKENRPSQPATASCRAVALADAWVQRQREKEAELTRFDLGEDFESISGAACQSSQQSTASGVSTSSACRRISFQPQPAQCDGGSSGSQIIRRASQLFANLVSP